MTETITLTTDKDSGSIPEVPKYELPPLPPLPPLPGEINSEQLIVPETKIESDLQSVTELAGEVALSETVEVSDAESIVNYGDTELSRQLNEKLTPEALENRTKEALDVIDFEPSKEVAEQLKTFFETHYSLALGINSILSEDPKTITAEKREEQIEILNSILDKQAGDSLISDENLEIVYKSVIDSGYEGIPRIARLITPFLTKVRFDRLQNPDDEQLERTEQQLLAYGAMSLFNEASLGITALDETDKSLITDLNSRVLQMIKGSKHFDNNGITVTELPSKANYRGVPLVSLESPLEKVERNEKLFWDDTLFAGQLLFHNSMNMVETRSDGKLMPRRMQQKYKGKMHGQTAEELEGYLHSPTIHWSEFFSPHEYKGHTDKRGTIAMPIKKIIEAAPYARDSQYAVLRVKPERLDSVKSRVKLRAGKGSIGMGSIDRQGAASTDRTFYSSAKDVEPDVPIEQAPDGYFIKQGPEDYAVTLNKEETEIARLSGVGESFPAIFEIDAPEIVPGETVDQRSEKIDQKIKELQSLSAAKYPNEFVVPVRSGGVLDFQIPDDNPYSLRSRAKFTEIK